MTYSEALAFFGGTQVRLAAALGVAQPTVSCWRGVIPAPYQYQIEVISGGALKVDGPLRRPASHQEAA